MKVRFEDFAYVGLRAVSNDDDRMRAFGASISLKLRLQKNYEDYCRRLYAWPGREIWVTKIGIARVVFEVVQFSGDVIIWSVSQSQ